MLEMGDLRVVIGKVLDHRIPFPGDHRVEEEAIAVPVDQGMRMAIGSHYRSHPQSLKQPRGSWIFDPMGMVTSAPGTTGCRIRTM